MLPIKNPPLLSVLSSFISSTHFSSKHYQDGWSPEQVAHATEKQDVKSAK